MPVEVTKDVNSSIQDFVSHLLKLLKDANHWAEWKVELAKNNLEYSSWSRMMDNITQNGTVTPLLCTIDREFQDVFNYISEKMSNEKNNPYNILFFQSEKGDITVLGDKRAMQRFVELQKEYAVIYGKVANEIPTTDFNAILNTNEQYITAIKGLTPEQAEYIQNKSFDNITDYSYTKFVDKNNNLIIATTDKNLNDFKSFLYNEYL